MLAPSTLRAARARASRARCRRLLAAALRIGQRLRFEAELRAPRLKESSIKTYCRDGGCLPTVAQRDLDAVALRRRSS